MKILRNGQWVEVESGPEARAKLLAERKAETERKAKLQSDLEEFRAEITRTVSIRTNRKR